MKKAFLFLSLLTLSGFTHATEPPIKGFGLFYSLTEYQPISKDTRFKLAFDVADGAEKGQTNFSINSLARFINMHVAHGVPLENIELALVVHGSATLDLLKNSVYSERFAKTNKNQSLLEQLMANNTQVYLCGQSASHQKVAKSDLIPGVEVTLSAMTAHAMLQQQEYALNPF